jgi:hypothetical protein
MASLCAGEPLKTSKHFTLYRCPPGCDAERVLEEAERTAAAACRWVGCDESNPPIRILVFTPDAIQGRQWLSQRGTRHACTGSFLVKNRILVLIGRGDDPYFWNVLRHEAAHTAFVPFQESHVMVPFWLAEGTACLFETGVDAQDHPSPNPERLELARYLVKNRWSLNLKPLVRQPLISPADGMAYAKAWAVTAYLYQTGRRPDRYLRGLYSSPADFFALFERTMLGPEGAFRDFEQSVSRFVTEAETNRR